MSRFTIVLSLALAACSKSDSPAPPPATASANPAKDVQAARKMIAEGAVVIDVRTAAEVAEGHLPQATSIPLQDFSQRIAEVDALTAHDKAKPIVVYCASGNRSGKAKQLLEAAGYTQVVNGGGFDDLR